MFVFPERHDGDRHPRVWCLAVALFLPLLAACPGTLDPAVGTVPTTGTGGTNGAGGNTGAGGGMAACDAPAVVFDNPVHGCTVPICHGGTTKPELSVANVGVALKGMKASAACMSLDYVNPSNPANSALVRVVSGTTCGGMMMPIGGSPLNQEEINCLSDWISKIP